MGNHLPVKTRIAPSPTGKMHIGTARTALFNKLFAHHHGGTYCVRIEDTDHERSTPENIEFIKEALTWLNLEPDETYILQSANQATHVAAAKELLAKGKAYEAEGAIRFKIPQDLENHAHTTWHDLVQGTITVEHKQLEDFVLLRSDGTPTYHLGVVVDDAKMAITHIIRGDDHINNTPKQILLHQALAKKGSIPHIPQFAHIPLIYGEDGTKLSKRHGAVSVQEFRDAGILANAMNHYLMQLSWLEGDDETIRTLEQAAEAFNLAEISKNPARFDQEKLKHLNAIHLRQTNNISLLEALRPYFDKHNWPFGEIEHARLLKAIPHLKERAQTLADLAETAAGFVRPLPFAYENGDKEHLSQAQPHLQALIKEFGDATWDADLLHQIVKDYVKDHDLKFPEVGKPLRLALIGTPHGPGLNDMLAALGREETLNRLTQALS